MEVVNGGGMFADGRARILAVISCRGTDENEGWPVIGRASLYRRSAQR